MLGSWVQRWVGIASAFWWSKRALWPLWWAVHNFKTNWEGFPLISAFTNERIYNQQWWQHPLSVHQRKAQAKGALMHPFNQVKQQPARVLNNYNHFRFSSPSVRVGTGLCLLLFRKLRWWNPSIRMEVDHKASKSSTRGQMGMLEQGANGMLRC